MVIVVCPAWATNSNYNCKTRMIRLIWWNHKTSNHTTYGIKHISIGLMCCWSRQQHDYALEETLRFWHHWYTHNLFCFWFLVLFC
jgi:hypothetical protein